MSEIKLFMEFKNYWTENYKETIKYFNYIKDIKIQKEYEYKFEK